MLTPKEKAKELLDKFKNIDVECDDSIEGNYFMTMNKSDAKQCALIVVDEMIVQNGDIYLAMLGDKTNDYYVKMNSYLFEVKQEIEKL